MVTGPYDGRPAEQRLPEENACYDFLDSLPVAYRRVDHDPAFTIADCHQVEKALGAPIAKNLFLCTRQRDRFFLLLMPGDKVFKTKYLSGQLQCSRLSFAPAEDLQRLLGVQPGSASLLGLLFDRDRQVELVIDRALLAGAAIGLHPLPEYFHPGHCRPGFVWPGDPRPGGGSPSWWRCRRIPSDRPVLPPTPSGRMHMGNLFSALLAWLSVRRQGGELILRMEDLDTQRTSAAYASQLRRDLSWLGLTWDRETPPQSRRTAAYQAAFARLAPLTYPCYCTRSQLAQRQCNTRSSVMCMTAGAGT